MKNFWKILTFLLGILCLVLILTNYFDNRAEEKEIKESYESLLELSKQNQFAEICNLEEKVCCNMKTKECYKVGG